MIKKRIPASAIQAGIAKVLTNYVITIGEHIVKTYDYVPKGAEFPYNTLGAITCKRKPNKTVDIYDISQQIHIWSKHSGKAEVNEIANDVTNILTSIHIDLAADGFKVLEQDVDFYEAFPGETAGYHGVITFIASIQNVG